MELNMLLIGELVAPQDLKLVALGLGDLGDKHGSTDKREPLDIVCYINFYTAVEVCTCKGRVLGVWVVVDMPHRIYKV